MKSERTGIAFVALVALALPAALSGGCTTKKVEIPELSGPSEATSPIPVIVAPAPKPSPSPAPDASPTPPNPNPTPDPTPTPTPTPAASCRLTASRDNGCGRGDDPNFLAAVDDAITQVVNQQPQLFDLTDGKCPNCYKVRNPDGFLNALLGAASQRGLCAMYDGEELAVKNVNDFSEQYDVLTADLYLRRGEGSYRATCRPAAF
jgi:hypothetical protein